MADQIRVLVVDDIPETRDHLTKLLGFESDIDVVGAAASGREAVEMAVRLSPDVVLMDINMPDMDGITATEQLSASAPGAAVVMMSVQGEADYLRRSMLAGACEFLVKPFSSDELTPSIRQVSARERDKQSRMAVAPVAAGSSSGGSPSAGGEAREPGLVVAVFSPNDVRRMIDIEFISEISISYLHGLQNKKDTLDDWYEAYEAEYEEKFRVETVFNTVLGELVAVILDIERTRWRKKSDFYTLFLCLAEFSDSLPLDKLGREQLRRVLLQFGSDVDKFIRDPVANEGVADEVKNYTAAVERAASDLASRRQRRENLFAVVKDILSPAVSTELT
jgi:DNA-binding NarL/FixJ family response regulator